MENEIKYFVDQIAKQSPLQLKNVQNYINAMWPLEKGKLERRIQYLLNQGETYESIADAYLNYCFYFAEERKYFIRNGTYRYSTFNEVSQLYKNTEYMKNYMIGLSISIYLWQIQRENMRFFREKCKAYKQVKGGRYLEIGPGHGEYLITAVENMSFDEYYAVDISDTAAKMTECFLAFVLKDDEDKLRKIKIENKDFFDISHDDKFDAIVMSEVIEHVENPKDFLIQIKKLAKDNAYIYLSTAINSPFPDHLYHFHNKREVYSLIEKAGLKIIDEVISTVDGVSIEKAVKKNYDITIGVILTI